MSHHHAGEGATHWDGCGCQGIKFVIPGQPQAAQRPRMGRYGNFYSPSSKDQRKVGLALLGSRVMAGNKVLSGLLALHVTFYFKPHGRRKFDLDNLLKFIMDAGNGILWVDDTQITGVRAEKVEDKMNPRTEVEVFEWSRK